MKNAPKILYFTALIECPIPSIILHHLLFNTGSELANRFLPAGMTTPKKKNLSYALFPMLGTSSALSAGVSHLVAIPGTKYAATYPGISLSGFLSGQHFPPSSGVLNGQWFLYPLIYTVLIYTAP